MDTGVTYHQDLKHSGRWSEMAFAAQMANIGSEISRARKWKVKEKPDMMWKALERGLELLDFTISASQGSRLHELLRLREVICDYFVGSNEYNTDGNSLQSYFDNFAFITQS